jgi:hypothetical protein
VDLGQAAVMPTARSWLSSCAGRDGELRAIGAFLLDGDDVARCLTLAGDAGIGKTTVWEAGCECARVQGFRVLSTRASQAENGLSFAGMAGLVDGAGPAALAALPGPQLRALQVAIRVAEPGQDIFGPRVRALAVLSGHDRGLARATAAAAETAAERGAIVDAELLAGHALRLTPPGSPDYPGRLLALARCRLAAGDLARAGELLSHRLHGLPPGPDRGRAHVMPGEAASAVGEEAHLDQALAEAGDDAGLRARALARKAMVLAVSMGERLTEAGRAAGEASRVARDSGNGTRLLALSAQAWTRVLRGWPIGDLRQPGARSPAAMSGGGQEASIDRAFGVRLAFRGGLEQARVVFERLRGRPGECGDLRENLAATIQLCELNLRAGDARQAGPLIDELEQWPGLAEMRAVTARLRALLAAITGLPAGAARHAAVARATEPAGFRWDWLEATRAAGIAALFDEHRIQVADPEVEHGLLGAGPEVAGPGLERREHRQPAFLTPHRPFSSASSADPVWQRVQNTQLKPSAGPDRGNSVPRW